MIDLSKRVALLLAGSALFAGVVSTGNPAAAAVSVDSSLYCSAGADATINSDTSAEMLSTSNVDLTIDGSLYQSSDCYGAFPATPAAAAEEADINAIWGGGFTLLAKSDEPAAGSLLDGVDFDLTADEVVSGNWTVSWDDTGGVLPFTVDFAVLLNSGTSAATYLLESVGIPTSPTSGSGTFTIAFDNPGGRIGDLSHLSLAAKITDTPHIPVPASFLLFGAGLLGLGLGARRYRQ